MQISLLRAGVNGFGALLLGLLVWSAIGIAARAQTSNQRVGSVLVFSHYTSSTSTPMTQNTRIALANTDQTTSAYVALFFIDRMTGTAADRVICLAPNQTRAFLAFDLDPGITGYLIAIAVDAQGCPVGHNFLTGAATVKESFGYTATLAAEAFRALFSGTWFNCNESSVSTTLLFNGTMYERAPRVLALDKLHSVLDSTQTLLRVVRLGGDLTNGIGPVGSLSGTLYDEAGVGYDFVVNGAGATVAGTLGDLFPATTPVFSEALPEGQVGWMKIASTVDSGILGAVVQYSPLAGFSELSYIGGHTLRKLELATSTSLTIPVRRPSCQQMP